VDAVVVYGRGGVLRSTVDTLETTRKLDKRDISFHSIQETLDTKSAMRKFFFTLAVALAEIHRGIIRESIRAALTHKKAKNEKTDGLWIIIFVSFGYGLAFTGDLEPNKAEQKATWLICELNEKGYSYRAP
jgi:DNA invertase Pin-like site-specific DNA recombinase